MGIRSSLLWIGALLLAAPRLEAGRRELAEGWALQAAAQVPAGGERVSQPGFDTSGWHRVRVPNTVVGALVENGHLGDPYFGMNLRGLAGTSYPIGERFALLPMPEDSPYFGAWWYRLEFAVPLALAGRSFSLHFDGINYRAGIWLNGTRIAGPEEVAGAFRRYELDVGGLLRPGEANALAVEVSKPEPHDLAIMWVDWNPTPPDKNLGLWGPVALSDSGPVALRHPHVVSRLELPSLARARLEVTTQVWNRGDRPQRALLRGAIGEVQFSRALELAPRERRTVRFTPEEVAGLVVEKPRLWWPYRLGAQELHTLALDVEVAGLISDRVEQRFGIQQIDSELTGEGHRVFRVNGRRLLVRGGGWASDMMLRPATTERLEAELRYLREMGLNTIRLEGKLESDELYDLADRHGILLMPGWCCCDQWERWKEWDVEDRRVAPLSLRDQILRLRNHPSVMAWLNGSDFPPPADVERAYLDVLRELEWPKPVVSNATDAPGPVSGPSGFKMRGPYDYVPPSYWLTDTRHGGAFGFATEVGPGAAVPPVESLRRMLPADKLWPPNEHWTFHAGGDEFKDLKLFDGALAARYGPPAGLEDYARKAQALAYDGQRAMFEAFGRNKYRATGVIQWMLNNAWPSMIWHLYDYFLRPGGGYFGAKKACEPLHVQYSYDDRSVVVVNDTATGHAGLLVRAQVLDLAARVLSQQESPAAVAPDGVARVLRLPPPAGVEGAYFVRLELEDAARRVVSRNFYWLSTRDDVLDWKATQWYYTPTRRHADLRALLTLPQARLSLSPPTFGEASALEGRARVKVENQGPGLAFQVRLKLVDPASGEELLPVFWEDNYLALLPGEARELEVSFARRREAAPPRLEAEAWNAPPVRP